MGLATKINTVGRLSSEQYSTKTTILNQMKLSEILVDMIPPILNFDGSDNYTVSVCTFCIEF